MKGGCSPVDKTVIVYRPTSTKCQDDSSKFAFDPDRGIVVLVIEYYFSVGIDSSQCNSIVCWKSIREDRTNRCGVSCC